eukprot:comp22509_c0_seq1/m.56286 comp22509_c0_seq1/g.56286  ORF comp22509_c0_seq1/g.56286 comp22509_c0_seq1/m.56286 type:complete len:461 (-) comp22509_c0_seq1:4153-5535(-)
MLIRGTSHCGELVNPRMHDAHRPLMQRAFQLQLGTQGLSENKNVSTGETYDAVTANELTPSIVTTTGTGTSMCGPELGTFGVVHVTVETESHCALGQSNPARVTRVTAAPFGSNTPTIISLIPPSGEKMRGFRSLTLGTAGLNEKITGADDTGAAPHIVTTTAPLGSPVTLDGSAGVVHVTRVLDIHTREAQLNPATVIICKSPALVPRLEPVIVSTVPPLRGPLIGEMATLMADPGTAAVYVNVAAAVAFVAFAAAVNTVTNTAPGTATGPVVHLIIVALTHVRAVQSASPSCTLVTAKLALLFPNPPPYTVTRSPPSALPVAGNIPVTRNRATSTGTEGTGVLSATVYTVVYAGSSAVAVIVINTDPAEIASGAEALNPFAVWPETKTVHPAVRHTYLKNTALTLSELSVTVPESSTAGAVMIKVSLNTNSGTLVLLLHHRESSTSTESLCWRCTFNT